MREKLHFKINFVFHLETVHENDGCQIVCRLGVTIDYRHTVIHSFILS